MGRFDGGDGRAAGSADVVDDKDGSICLGEAFDFAARAVGLLCFADEKPVDESALACICMALRTRNRYGRDDRIGTERKAADGMWIEVVLMEKVEDGETGKTRALSMQCCGTAVDVVIAVSARGELEIAELEGLFCKKSEELLAGELLVEAG